MRCARERTSSFGNGGVYRTSKPATLYLLNLGDRFIKVGVSIDIEKRIRMLQRETDLTVKVIQAIEGPASKIAALERHIIYRSNLNSYETGLEFRGKSECFSVSDIDAITSIIASRQHMWEKTGKR